jgi:hypothetical protein
MDTQLAATPVSTVSRAEVEAKDLAIEQLHAKIGGLEDDKKRLKVLAYRSFEKIRDVVFCELAKSGWHSKICMGEPPVGCEQCSNVSHQDILNMVAEFSGLDQRTTYKNVKGAFGYREEFYRTAKSYRLVRS